MNSGISGRVTARIAADSRSTRSSQTTIVTGTIAPATSAGRYPPKVPSSASIPSVSALTAAPVEVSPPPALAA
jgi:hypothetical protein